jgi:hypothetical protein
MLIWIHQGAVFRLRRSGTEVSCCTRDRWDRAHIVGTTQHNPYTEVQMMDCQTFRGYMLAAAPDTSEDHEESATNHLRACHECRLWLEVGEKSHAQWRRENEALVAALLRETVRRDGHRCLGLLSLGTLP